MKKIFPCIIGLGYVGLPLFVSLKKKISNDWLRYKQNSY